MDLLDSHKEIPTHPSVDINNKLRSAAATTTHKMEKTSSSQRKSRGAWTALEDKLLRDFVKTHGPGKWRNVSQKIGLNRNGKSCRLRWLNYLRPDVKRGNISPEEEDLIIRLHRLLGNRWSLIAGRLPGRSDNEIKNYWNTTLAKRVVVRDQHYKPGRKEKEEPSNTDGALANIDDKASKWSDIMDDFREDGSQNPEAISSVGKLFQYDETDITAIDCGQLWNFSDLGSCMWGSTGGNSSGGDNAQWSDFFA